ncbi:U3 snoRNP protein [Homalodisca vitripennis]|nr:U3 snoRNP protein [Homalodisca vitripennis]
MSLLVNTKTHGSVINTVMDMVDRLLNLEDNISEQEAHSTPPLLVSNLLPVENYDIKGDVSLGSRILFPHVPSVLERMKTKLKRPKSTMGQRDLNILSHVTGLCHDSDTSETLLTLLLPVVGRRAGAGEHIVCPLISTVTNLISNVAEPHQYIRNLAPLFGSVVGAEPRRLLSSLVKSIDNKDNKLNAKLLEGLNAWNAKWLDQPDFERRLDAFKTIQQLNSSGQISLEQGVIIIYTCHYFIRTEKDMSLRDSASQCLHTLCPSLSKRYPEDRDFLVSKTILGLIAAGIRDKKSEQTQQEAVILLGYMARECAELHPVLRDFSLLGNKVDLEVDFFENLQHLQLHRKVRALLKFCEVSKGLTKLPCTRTLTQFVLPIISQFLCSERYSNKNTIVDAAIEALGTVCKMLPWHHYELVLRYYLGKLRQSVEFQKQLVRIIVAILNAFHFDLSNSDIKGVEPSELKEVKSEDITVEKDENKEKTENGPDELDPENEDENKSKGNEDLEDVLNNYDTINEDQEAAEIIEVTEESILERQTILSKSLATRVVYIIKTILLPQLHRTITARTQSDAMHKVNRKLAGPDRDEEDILRIPIALAVVKLLQRLPEEVLQQNICGILMKLCTFLKSRLDSVRRVTRETLQKVIVSLGSSYLRQMIQEMTAILTHGFHVHVLVYSIHRAACVLMLPHSGVLVAAKPLLKMGDLDPCVSLVVDACRTDLFGKTSEEKEVKQIAGNLMEARANRSYDMYHILAEFITQKSLINLIVPLKEELGHTMSHKAINKGRECLRHIVLGLVDNKFVTTEALLIFAYGTASESIPALFADLKKDLKDEKTEKVLLEPKTDSFIIPQEPKSRPTVQSKLCARTNAHIFVEFGLMLYQFLLKRDKIKGDDYRPHLDPLVRVLTDCLKSEYVKISTLSLQCLCWVLKYDLPSVHTNIQDITEWVFKLLHKYAAAGLSKGDNFDLVMAAFKVVAVVVRDVKLHQLTRQQQRTLLQYCEQDVHNYSRQTLAFSLLKAILGRGWKLPELNAVMEKVAKISITADHDHVRLQARQVFHQYLMGYALGKKFEKHLTWYLQQLEYDLQPGRESALEMIKTLINTLPPNPDYSRPLIFLENPDCGRPLIFLENPDYGRPLIFLENPDYGRPPTHQLNGRRDSAITLSTRPLDLDLCLRMGRDTGRRITRPLALFAQIRDGGLLDRWHFSLRYGTADYSAVGTFRSDTGRRITRPLALKGLSVKDILKEQSGFIFVTVAARLVNDDVPACRKMAADIIVQLLDKVNNNVRDSLFDIILLWMQDKKVLHRRLAVQLCGIFAGRDQANFENRLKVVLPHIISQIQEEVRELRPQAGQHENIDIKEQLRDHHLYQLLHLIVKLSTLCPNMMTDTIHVRNIHTLADNTQTLLAYPHEWVRLSAAQFIGRVLSVLSPQEVADSANSLDEDNARTGYLLYNTRETLRTLTLDLCSQLTPGVELNDKLLMQLLRTVFPTLFPRMAMLLEFLETGFPASRLSSCCYRRPSGGWRQCLGGRGSCCLAQSNALSTSVRQVKFCWVSAEPSRAVPCDRCEQKSTRQQIQTILNPSVARSDLASALTRPTMPLTPLAFPAVPPTSAAVTPATAINTRMVTLEPVELFRYLQADDFTVAGIRWVLFAVEHHLSMSLNKGVPPPAYFDWKGWFIAGLPFFRRRPLLSTNLTHPEYPVTPEAAQREVTYSQHLVYEGIKRAGRANNINIDKKMVMKCRQARSWCQEYLADQRKANAAIADNQERKPGREFRLLSTTLRKKGLR